MSKFRFKFTRRHSSRSHQSRLPLSGPRCWADTRQLSQIGFFFVFRMKVAIFVSITSSPKGFRLDRVHTYPYAVVQLMINVYSAGVRLSVFSAESNDIHCRVRQNSNYPCLPQGRRWTRGKRTNPSLFHRVTTALRCSNINCAIGRN